MPKRKRNVDTSVSKIQPDSTNNAEEVKIHGKTVSFTESTLPKALQKYWWQRYRLFERFDEGIYMDEESWYSVTPEPLATQIAEEVDACRAKVIVDGFCGAGGNAIAFAKHADLVYAWDIDETKIKCAKHNAEIYGVAERIHFQVGSFFDLIDTVKADCIFLSPPWGGPTYTDQNIFDLSAMQPYSAKQLLIASRRVSDNIVLYIPRQSNQRQIAALQEPPGKVELQYLKCNGSMKALAVYFGNLASHLSFKCTN